MFPAAALDAAARGPDTRGGLGVRGTGRAARPGLEGGQGVVREGPAMAASSRAERHLRHWLRHRRPLLELVARLPESAAGFRPWEGAMTTAALVAHVARSTDRFVRAVQSGSSLSPPGAGERPAPPATMAEAADLLRRLTEEDRACLEGVDDARLDATMEFGPLGPMAALALLAAALDHEIHHKGQLWTYARMCGVEPPLFVAARD